MEPQDDEEGIGPDWERPITAEQIPLQQAIMAQLVAVLPESWAQGSFTFRLRDRGAVIPKRVTNPQTGEGVPVPPELAEAASALHGYCRKFGLSWPIVVFTASRFEGEWEFRIAVRS